MNRFNHYFANDFKACRLLAYARDHCRNRDVRLYQIPGAMDCVGVTDGTDRWIAPAVESIFSVNVKQMLRDISDGKPLPSPKPPGSSRVRLEEAEDPEPPLRTRRVKLEEDQQPAPRSQRVLLA